MCTWNILQDRTHLENKSSLSKFKETEIISSIFSDHNAMRLGINYREKKCKNTSTWKLNQLFLNNLQVTKEKGNKKFLETNDNENMATQNLWDAAKAVLRRRFIAIKSYLKKQEKHRINNPTLHLKQLEKEQKNPQNL